MKLAAGIILFATLSAAATSADVGKLKVLHSFCRHGDDCPNYGGGVLRDSAGNLYGTGGLTGGANDAGAVFMITPSGQYRILHRFCRKTACRDGRGPVGAPIMDVSGNLYGVTASDGKAANGNNGAGTVYELSPSAAGARWALRTLYDFNYTTRISDGYGPLASLNYAGQQAGALYDGTSPLFGTTNRGGVSLPNSDGPGTVFELDFVPGQTKRKLVVLYRFCQAGWCPDGSNPNSPMIMDAKRQPFRGHAMGREGCL
jgi:uncharacterized repeat protein (TIGR03803 family)